HQLNGIEALASARLPGECIQEYTTCDIDIDDIKATIAIAVNPARIRIFSGSGLDNEAALIRYFLYHPLTPSPLRFSRNRFLRHWTIHRAWQLHLAKQRAAHKRELQRQYEAMKQANEELRTGAGDGGWLFKMAMSKHRLYKEPVPIEYGRLQTETPSKSGWNYEWKREVESSV
ncbi:hypothetical protein KEM56_001576, partial [Ascosphaera pollenicola]